MLAEFRWTALPELYTSRLHLRALTERDRNDLLAIYGDAEVMRYTSDPPFRELAYVDQMLASVAKLFTERQSVEWGVTLRDTHRVIGTCGLHSFDAETESAEIGCILNRVYWGQGLMREELEAVIMFGFERLDLHTICADIDVPNHRSIRLFQRLHFQQEQPNSTIYLRQNPTLKAKPKQ